MKNSVAKSVIIFGLINLSSMAFAETPSQDAAGGDKQSEAACTAVEACNGKCHSQVNDVNFTENRFSERMKVTDILKNKDLSQDNFGKGDKVVSQSEAL